MFISSRAMRAAHGVAKPRLVRLQLRGLERVPRAGVDIPRSEAEGPATTGRGDRPPNRPCEPRTPRAVGSRLGRVPHARGEGPRAPLRAHAGRSGPPRRAEWISAIRHPDGPRGPPGGIRPENPRLERLAVPRVLAEDPRPRHGRGSDCDVARRRGRTHGRHVALGRCVRGPIGNRRDEVRGRQLRIHPEALLRCNEHLSDRARAALEGDSADRPRRARADRLRERVELRSARGDGRAPQGLVPPLRLDAHAGDVRDVPRDLRRRARLSGREGQGHEDDVRADRLRPLRVPGGMVGTGTGPTAMAWRIDGASARRYAWTTSSRAPASVTNMTTGAMTARNG